MVYQNKLVEVRDQLADATFQMDSMANEYLSTKESLKNHTSLIESIQEENKRLALMMEEYHEEKRSNEQRMEQMGTEVSCQGWPCKRFPLNSLAVDQILSVPLVCFTHSS